VDWAALPEDLVLGVHWHCTAEFVSLLERQGFRVIALARHPWTC
jgi:hypothetical protein